MRDGWACPCGAPGCAGEWKALVTLGLSWSLDGLTLTGSLLSSQGTPIAQALPTWAWKIPSSLLRGVRLRRSWDFLKGTIPRKLMAKQKIKENPWIIAAAGLAGSVTKVWPQWAPCSRAFGELGPGCSVYLSALPVARYPSCSEWLSCAAASPCRGAVAGSDHSWPQFLPSWSSTYP